LVVRIGIDFGSAYSKLAMRVAGKVFFVDMDGLHGGEVRYLLGGELSEVKGGDAYIGRAPDAEHVATNLKLPFLGVDKAAGPLERARAVAFVAWILRYARAWLYHTKPSLIAGNTLIWEANIGAPTGSWQKGDQLLDHYKRIGLAAWRLSQEERVSVDRASKLLESTDASSDGWGLDRLGIVPEFAAQIAGYVKSPQRTDGLYVLADVGAGTLDVACFRIMRIPLTTQDTFPVFASEVQPLGAHYLMQTREHALGRPMTGWNSTRKVPSASEVAAALRVPLNTVLDSDREFEKLVSQTVHRVLTATRHEKERNAPEWTSEMPVFFAGGGASLEPYRRGVAKAFSMLGGLKHSPRSLPISRGTEAVFEIDDEASSRMSVAYGLTYDADEIGEFVPPGKIGPHEIWTSPHRVRPDRDELYPK
jgi:hypothetical protein